MAYEIQFFDGSDEQIERMYELTQEITQNWNSKIGIFGYDFQKFKAYFTDLMIDNDLNPLLYIDGNIVGYLTGKITTTFSLLGSSATLWAPVVFPEYNKHTQNLLKYELRQLKNRNVDTVTIFAGSALEGSDTLVTNAGFQLKHTRQTNVNAPLKFLQTEVLDLQIESTLKNYKDYTDEWQDNLLNLVNKRFPGEERRTMEWLKQKQESGNTIRTLLIQDELVAIISLNIDQNNGQTIAVIDNTIFDYQHKNAEEIMLSMIREAIIMARDLSATSLEIQRTLPVPFLKRLSPIGFKVNILAGEYVMQL